MKTMKVSRSTRLINPKSDARSERRMSSSTGIPLDPGPMDVDDSIAAPASSAASAGGDGADSQNSPAPNSNSSSDKGNPEVEMGGGGGGGGRAQAGQESGSERNSSGNNNIPTPPLVSSISGGAGSSIVGSVPDKAAAPEDSGGPGQQPRLPEVKLVPLPPGFGKTLSRCAVLYCCTVLIG